jgi:ATP-dependent exoDNAse (exonuclease V) alpha subunit
MISLLPLIPVKGLDPAQTRQRSGGVAALNRSVRMTLGLEGAPQVGDIILVTANCYNAPLALDPDRATPKEGLTVDIFNGERCEIVRRESDFFDARFPGSKVRAERIVRFLSDGPNPPEGTAYGYAMSVHRCQGSQFQHVILVTARPDRFVWWASLYTAVTRTRKHLTIVGDESDLADWAGKAAPPRRTLLERK